MIIFTIPICWASCSFPTASLCSRRCFTWRWLSLLSVSVLDLSCSRQAATCLSPGFVVALFYFFVHEQIGQERERQASGHASAGTSAAGRQSGLKADGGEFRMTMNHCKRRILERTQAEHALRESEVVNPHHLRAGI